MSIWLSARCFLLVGATLLVGACSLLDGTSPPAEGSVDVSAAEPCGCPGGHSGAMWDDAQGQARCVCLLQFPEAQEVTRSVTMLDGRGDEVRTLALAEGLGTVFAFLPDRGLLLANQPSDDCSGGLVAYSLVTGQVARRISEPGLCGSMPLISADQRQLYLVRRGEDSGDNFVSPYTFAEFARVDVAPRIEIGAGSYRDWLSAVLDAGTLLIVLKVRPSDDGSEDYHRFLRVDLTTREVRELFVIGPGENPARVHATAQTIAVSVERDGDPIGVYETRAYDSDSGQLQGSVAGLLLSEDGPLFVVRDQEDQVRTWQPAQGEGLSSESYGVGGLQAIESGDALALTGVGPELKSTWVYRVSTGERTIDFDGRGDVEGNGRLVPMVRFLAPDANAISQLNVVCQSDQCGSGGGVLLIAGQERIDTFISFVINSGTHFMTFAGDPATPASGSFTLNALDPADLSITALRSFAIDKLFKAYASGLDFPEY